LLKLRSRMAKACSGLSGSRTSSCASSPSSFPSLKSLSSILSRYKKFTYLLPSDLMFGDRHGDEVSIRQTAKQFKIIFIRDMDNPRTIFINKMYTFYHKIFQYNKLKTMRHCVLIFVLTRANNLTSLCKTESFKTTR
jgi:hypothetical protein